MLTQIQSLLDQGMTEDEIQAMIPEIDFTTALAVSYTHLDVYKRQAHDRELQDERGTNHYPPEWLG